MSYALNTVANYFIRKAREAGCSDLTPMKLLKLVYIAHGWSLAIHNKALFHEEVEAWKYGPVVRELYHEVKPYRNSPIQHDLHEPSYSTPVKQEDAALLEKIWDVYGNFSGIDLSAITHREGSPWYETWDGRGLHGLVIPTSKIREHYLQLATRGQNQRQAHAATA